MPNDLLQRLRTEDSFENETFSGLDLGSSALSGKEFYRVTFENCTAQESRWTKSRFEDCEFKACDLTRASFAHSGLHDVRFVGSKLMGIEWSSIAANPELLFRECNLRYCSFVGLSLRKTQFEKCLAQEANFLDSDLSESDFSGTNLSSSNFRGCTLLKTDFRGATGLFLEPSRNKVKGALVPVETAVALAQFAGMIVAGYGDDLPSKKRK